MVSAVRLCVRRVSRCAPFGTVDLFSFFFKVHSSWRCLVCGACGVAAAVAAGGVCCVGVGGVNDKKQIKAR
jgi:hypothetical protein